MSQDKVAHVAAVLLCVEVLVTSQPVLVSMRLEHLLKRRGFVATIAIGTQTRSNVLWQGAVTRSLV